MVFVMAHQLWLSRRRMQKNNGRLYLNTDTGVVLNDMGTVFGDLVPVDNIPPVGDILWSAVLVLQVVTAMGRGFMAW